MENPIPFFNFLLEILINETIPVTIEARLEPTTKIKKKIEINLTPNATSNKKTGLINDK